MVDVFRCIGLFQPTPQVGAAAVLHHVFGLFHFIAPGGRNHVENQTKV